MGVNEWNAGCEGHTHTQAFAPIMNDSFVPMRSIMFLLEIKMGVMDGGGDTVDSLVGLRYDYSAWAMNIHNGRPIMLEDAP